MMITILLSLCIFFVLLNIIFGVKMEKRYGKWQYGVVNWGMALFLGITLIEKLIAMF